MKTRFAEFFVAHRKLILILFIVLALVCAVLIPLVNVNQDMTKYLPKDSAMRHGLDIMKAEFGDEGSSNLEVMFRGLSDTAQKEGIKEQMEQIEYVDSVDYEPGNSDYNRDGYTLYIINCDHKQYSEEASSIWQDVKDLYEEDYDIELAGTIHQSNQNGLPLWIALSAVGLIFLILLVMANAWIEPLAFLITIGIAVAINMGTYLFFPSISKTSFSIVALLQLALSMDYSIMLLNRYRQQRQVIPDKEEAMRQSLGLSFGAITGSSLTTFAGLLALLFMSFAMGADIGMALAKGVIISLICIFTVLPALLLGFDSLMIRTAKRTLPFDLPRLSGAQFKLRIPLTLLFVFLFAAGLIIRGGVDFSYSQQGTSKIDEIFGYENTIVMVYNTEDGPAAQRLAETLDEEEEVRSAVCYESTLGKERTAEGMRKFILDMEDSEDTDVDMDMDTDMIRLIYYDFYAGEDDLKLTIPRFVDCLQSDVLNDETFSASMDDDVREKVDDMEKFTDAGTLTRRMGASGLADFFGMKRSEAKQLLLYYQIKNGRSGGSMRLPDFVDFLIRDVATDSEYGKQISASDLKKLKSMRKYTRKKVMTKKRTYKKAAKILGMDPDQMKLIYITRFSGKGNKEPMTILDLAGVYDMMRNDPVLKDQFPQEQTEQLIQGLAQIGQMDPRPFKMEEMQETLTGYGMPLEEDALTLAYTYRLITESPKACRMSVQKVVHFMLSNKAIAGGMSKKEKKQMKQLRRIIDTSVSGKRLSASTMGNLLQMKANDVRQLYLLHQYMHGDTSGWKLSPQQFVNFLVNKVLTDDSMKDRIGDSAGDLKLAQRIINSVVAGREFTAAQLADLLGDYSDSMDEGSLKIVYEIYGSKHEYDESWTMDLTTMVRHLDDDMIERPAFASAMEEDEKEDLDEMRADLEEAAELLEGEHYGRMIIKADLEEDGDETRAFMSRVTDYTDENFTGETYLIGNTPMAYEMSRTFRRELNRITLITALFIFIIVLLTFRRLATPVILVLMIQCAVFLTMGVLNFLHIDMNYLALLIVQSIMMGATIDYAIIYSTYYVEHRANLPPPEAIRAAYRGSLQTILTSSIILICAVGLLSFAFSEPATRQICRILSVGCLTATILVIFVLPGILACLDRLVVKRRREEDS